MRMHQVGRVTAIVFGALLALTGCSTSASPAAPSPPEPSPVVPTGWLVFESDRDDPEYGDLYLAEIGAAPTRLTSTAKQEEIAGPCDPTGEKVLYTTSTNGISGDIWTVSRDGSNAANMTSTDEVDEASPSWSPDGTRFVFAAGTIGDPTTFNSDLYLYEVVSGEVTRLTDDPASDSQPAWSPDGTKIAFVSERGGSSSDLYLYTMVSGEVTRLTNDDSLDYSPAWSPDGSRITFRSNKEGQAADIYVVNADGAGRTNLTSSAAEEWAPAWSPDGSFIAFQTDRDGNWEIYAMRPDGSGAANLTANPRADQRPFWCPQAPAAGALAISCDEFGAGEPGADTTQERSVAVKAGQDFTITLCSNASTGYAWEEPAISGSAGVTLVDRQPVEPAAGSPPGAAGAEEFTFRAASAGTATIDFTYSQPWEGGDKGAWKARVTVDAS